MPFNIFAVGELLWDVFPDGPRFGGAPANFACSSAGLSNGHANVTLVSAVGNDELGKSALATLRDRGVDSSFVETNSFPTGRVDVSLDQHGVASYEFAENCAWDHIECSSELCEDASHADAICFGTLGQRSPVSQHSIRRLVLATPESALRILDVNIRQPYVSDALILESLSLANVLKLNEDELPIIAKLCGCEGSESTMLKSILRRFALRFVALTKGSRGSFLVSDQGENSHTGTRVPVVDTVGAGDAFTASMTLGLLAKHPMTTVLEYADRVASYVCQQAGASPEFPSDLKFRHG